MALKNREQEQTQEDLINLELYIRSLWEFLPLPLCYLNPQCFILQVNKKFTEFSSYTPAEIIGEDVGKIFLEKDKMENLKKEVENQNKTEGEEFTLLKRGGEEVLVEVNTEMTRSPDGEFLGFFLAITDISEVKNFQQNLEAKVKEKTKELEEKVKELKTFQELVVRREEKMIELKKENKKLEEKIRGFQSSKQ